MEFTTKDTEFHHYATDPHDIESSDLDTYSHHHYQVIVPWNLHGG